MPILDLADSRVRIGRELRRGLETTGFVVLEGHGVSLDLIDRAYAAIEHFFGLPEPIKHEVAAGPDGQRGFTPFGVEHARDSATPDLKEFFHVGRDRYAANRWPEAPPELRDALSPLYAELDRCAARLLTTLAHAFDLPESTFSSLLREGNSILRALHYPPVREARDLHALRAAPHEDINLVTLLCGATGAGLEIKTPNGWSAIDTKRHQIVADSGDMLRQVTGGVIPSTTHRVVNPAGVANRSRYSLPFFAHPAPERDLSVLPKFATPERTAAFPPITAGAFLEQRLAEIGLGRTETND